MLDKIVISYCLILFLASFCWATLHHDALQEPLFNEAWLSEGGSIFLAGGTLVLLSFP
jgi:hypothetical protein